MDATNTMSQQSTVMKIYAENVQIVVICV